jgi:predicted DNA-binding transcriptional regulator YafY
VTGPALARELGVSIRTLYRDIATLQAQGADIHGEPGLGYVLRPGFTLPPLMFSTDEVEALMLRSRWVSVRGDARLGAAAENAAAKIRAVLPDALRESVDAATLSVPEFVPPRPATVDASVIRAAIRNERKLKIRYRDNNGTKTRRTIWPLVIGFFDRVLVLAAWCELRHRRLSSASVCGRGVQHDARRTFISIARADGARPDILRWETRGPLAISWTTTRRCRGRHSAKRSPRSTSICSKEN